MPHFNGLNCLNSYYPKFFTTSRVRLFQYKDEDILEAPDNAPTLEENNDWLRKLGRNSLKIDRSNLDRKGDENETYYIIEEEEEQYQGILDAAYKVLSTPKSSSSPYFKIAMQSSDFLTPSLAFGNTQNKTFQDLKFIKMRSGKGGNGAVSFLREANRSRGPPNGGDGGSGGNIYVQAVEGINSLHKLKTKYVAGDGSSGQKNQLDGKNGDDVIITVPVGTVIKWYPDINRLKQLSFTAKQAAVVAKCIGSFRGDVRPRFIQFFRKSYEVGKGWLFKDKDEEYHLTRDFFQKLAKKIKVYDQEQYNDELVNDIFPLEGIDLSKPTKEPVLLLRGGRGGMGNMHFLTPDIRNPRFAKMGRNSIEANFLFELKLLADLGLVGLPNSGKSTLLNAISNKRSKVGHWKFTTLQPIIGTIVSKSLVYKNSFTVADIPGIIEEASLDKGLGLKFLRHIERSGGLVFVISLENDPIADLKILLKELGPKRLEGKRILIVGTKADLEGSEKNFKALQNFTANELQLKCKLAPCCAMKAENVEAIVELMAEISGKNN
ncbi:hypothetical protein PACTADRAFT_73369 [Pachysolen tannophilus NRRL Y-2460]|uniref:Obg family GTPase CgtA n=1 Tax=Pachysolen tannophilus NRRL Y-2460 TaxID=669874 RepID=A0A1E4U0Z1_PACTA|nr:hypothetical protein PACTADRAFT_73369 [Pachysolen tannophilus NRRL Y-2460]